MRKSITQRRPPVGVVYHVSDKHRNLQLRVIPASGYVLCLQPRTCVERKKRMSTSPFFSEALPAPFLASCASIWTPLMLCTLSLDVPVDVFNSPASAMALSTCLLGQFPQASVVHSPPRPPPRPSPVSVCIRSHGCRHRLVYSLGTPRRSVWPGEQRRHDRRRQIRTHQGERNTYTPMDILLFWGKGNLEGNGAPALWGHQQILSVGNVVIQNLV